MLDTAFLSTGKLKDWDRPLLLNAGSAYLNVDGSGSPVEFSWGPAAGDIFRAYGLIFSWVSTAAKPTNFDGLFSKVSPIVTGIKCGLYRNSTMLVDFFDKNNSVGTGEYCTTNSLLAQFSDCDRAGCWSVTFADSGQTYHMAIQFRRDGGAVWRMVGDSGDTAKLTVAENLSSGLGAWCRLVGRYE